MALMDEFKEERAQIKNQPFKKRLQYFWDYNKWTVIAITFVVIMVSSIIYSNLTRKDTALWVAMVDCIQIDDKAESYKDALIETLEVDTSTHNVYFDTAYQVSAAYEVADNSVAEALSVRLATGEIDVFLANETLFTGYSSSDAFVDLRDVLTPEQLDYYKDSFYYIDLALVEELSSNNLLDENPAIYDIDHRSPEGMKDPAPIGIYVTGTDEFRSSYIFENGQEVVFGVVYDHCDVNYITTFLDTMTGRNS